MRHSIGLAWVAGFLITSALPLQAQTTYERFRDALNHRTPARVEPPPVEAPRRTTVVVPQREILVIERVRAPHGWWKRPGYRVITVYYDGGHFYPRPFDGRPIRKVVVYQRTGRYYIDEVVWSRDHRRYYGRDYDGWKGDDKRRHEDKWKDDDKRKDDDRWRNDDSRKHHDDNKDGSKGDNGHHRGHDKDKDKDRN